MESIKNKKDAIAKGIGYPEIFGYMYLDKQILLHFIQQKKTKLKELLDTKNKSIIQLYRKIPIETNIYLSESFSPLNKKYYRGEKIIHYMIQFIESQSQDSLIGPLILYKQNNVFDLDLCVSGKIEYIDIEYKNNKKLIDKTNENAIIRELKEEVKANISRNNLTTNLNVIYHKYTNLILKYRLFLFVK